MKKTIFICDCCKKVILDDELLEANTEEYDDLLGYDIKYENHFCSRKCLKDYQSK